MSTLASLVPPDEQPIVRKRAAGLGRHARKQSWPGSGPAPLRRRVCFLVAAIAPGLPPRRLSMLARYALWSFLFDDALDASGADPEALARTRDAVVGTLAGDRVPSGDPLRAGLARSLDDLSRYDRDGALTRRFGEAVRDAAAAEVEQVLLGRAVAAGARMPPTVDQFLPLAARTANYRSFAYALLVAVAGSLSESTLDRLDPALWQASRAVRLANDLRSVARDRAHAGLNIVDLRSAAGERVSRRWVLAEVDRCRREHDAGLREYDAGLAAPDPAGRALRRSLRLTVGAFRISEIR